MRNKLLALLLLVTTSTSAAIIDNNIISSIHKLNKYKVLPNNTANPNENKISLIIFATSESDMEEIEHNLKQIHEISYKRLKIIPAFFVTMPAITALVNEIAKYPGVARLSLNSEGEEETYLTAQSILLEPSDIYPALYNWHANGYLGQNQTVGMLDSGVDFTHPSLRDKAIHIRTEPGSHYENYQNGVRSPHGTGIACIYAGSGSPSFPQELGIAPNAPVIESALAGDKKSESNDRQGVFLTVNSLEWLLNRAPKKPNIINYSFGNGDSACKGCPDWSGMAKIVDNVINKYHILWVKSAGNHGWVKPDKKSPFISSITIPADNYNGLTVANMNIFVDGFKNGTPNRIYHQITNSSSRGPTVIGRKKPDITAPGNYTRACAPNPNIYKGINYTKAMDYRDEYRLMGGTSSATAITGGSVLLLKSAGINNPMAIKALLINSADAWDDSNVAVNNALSHHHQIAGSAWNPTYGWGYLNMDKAYLERKNIIFSELKTSSPQKSFEIYLALGGKVTIVHERRVGYDKSGKEWDLTPLNLKIYDKKTNELLDSDMSYIDTVHQVTNCKLNANKTKCNGKGRVVVIKVSLASKTIDGDTQEPFALAYSNS